MNGVLLLSPDTRTVELHWTVKANTPRMSYQQAVKDYEAEYARRYQIFMHGKSAETGNSTRQ